MNSTFWATRTRRTSPGPLVRAARLALLAGVIAAVGPRPADAGPISVGSGPDGGTASQFTYQADYASWLVADLSDPTTPAPLPISTGLGAGRWTQELSFGAGAPNLRTGDTFFLQELLAVDRGDFALRNWSQELLTPGWRWSDGTIFDNKTSEPVSGLRSSLSPGLAAFTFDPTVVGTDLLVVKVLEYIGPDDVAPTPITVRAYAVVPEPGAVTLLASGCLALLVVLRRRGRKLPAMFSRADFPRIGTLSNQEFP